MKTQNTQGSFILLIGTLIAKVQQFAYAPGVPLHPRGVMVASFLLRPLLCRCTQRRQAEEARLSQGVFRYCSSPSNTPSYASSFSSGVQG